MIQTGNRLLAHIVAFPRQLRLRRQAISRHVNRPLDFVFSAKQLYFAHTCRQFYLRAPKHVIARAREDNVDALRQLSHVFQRANQFNRPVIFVGSHFGNYSLACALGGEAIPRTTPRCAIADLKIVDDLVGHPELKRLFGEAFEIVDVNDPASLRRVLRALANNGVLAMLFDLPPAFGSPISCQFLGRTAYFAAGWLKLARHFRAIIVPVIAPSIASIHLEVLEPLSVDANVSEDEGAKSVLQHLVSDLERRIRMEPECWHMWRVVDQFFAEKPTGKSSSEER